MTVGVGTCSWADRTMVKAWYPSEVRSAADRLRYYAARFPTVEVDSTFYALPSERYSQAWVERTPGRFVFHVKAFGMMTQHSVARDRLPGELRDEYDYELTRYGRVKNPPKEMVRHAFRLFREGIEPLKRAGKLGLVLMQFPPYVTAKTPQHREWNQRWILRAQELLEDIKLAVEFRHISWMSEDGRERTLDFLRENGLTYVSVDEPRMDSYSVLPPVAEATAEEAYVRFHGRNQETWNKKTDSAAERFKYLYSEDELLEWIDPISRLAGNAERVWVMFNNCFADYAPRNAASMSSLLARAGLQVLPPADDESGDRRQDGPGTLS